MRRRRDIASSPVRATSETWAAITDLVSRSLEKSEQIDLNDVTAVMAAIAPAGLALVAGGHLDREPLVLIAEPLHLAIATVSGIDAFDAADNENTNPVPGAGTATDWCLHMPTPPNLESLVLEVTSSIAHVTVDAPPDGQESETGSRGGHQGLDLARLDPNARR